MNPLLKYIHFARVERAPEGETAAEARVRLADKFPRGSLRRMTHLGMLTGAAAHELVPGPDDAVAYASCYAETRALEDFLLSFPSASPQLFQTSIHPSAVQQVLIGRQQPVRRFWPVTGRARLVEHVLITALLEPAPRVIVLGGEERGTWLLVHGKASEAAYAFALSLGPDANGAIGEIRLTPTTATAGSTSSTSPLLPAFVDALEARAPQSWNAPAGQIGITWR